MGRGFSFQSYGMVAYSSNLPVISLLKNLRVIWLEPKSHSIHDHGISQKSISSSTAIDLKAGQSPLRNLCPTKQLCQFLFFYNIHKFYLWK